MVECDTEDLWFDLLNYLGYVCFRGIHQGRILVEFLQGIVGLLPFIYAKVRRHE